MFSTAKLRNSVSWISSVSICFSILDQSGRSDKLSDIYYSMRPFFPRYSHEGSGEELKDSTFSLILPIDFDGHTSNYMFTFMINDVVE